MRDRLDADLDDQFGGRERDRVPAGLRVASAERLCVSPG
jgi:hypothetical protein